MNDEVYMIAKTIDTCMFYGGIVITLVLTLKTKLKGIERYKFAITVATIFLAILGATNTFITIHKYQAIVAENSGNPDFENVPMIAGLICVFIFAVIIGVLWLIYAIWRRKLNKKPNKRL